MCVCLCVCMLCVCRWSRRPEEGIVSPGAGLTGHCDDPPGPEYSGRASSTLNQLLSLLFSSLLLKCGVFLGWYELFMEPQLEATTAVQV